MSDNQNFEAEIAFIDRLIAGDYLARIDAGTPLTDALRRLVRHLCITTRAGMDATVDVSIKTNETAIQAGNLLASLRGVNEQTQTIATASNEMVASVQEIGRNGEMISTKAQQSASAAHQGEQATQDARRRMEEINNVVKATKERVAALGDFTNQITGIAETIKKIASQTNLLALNATIEAARAGEAGKGFAVVAGEVKSLSSQTANATQQINNLVANLQTEMSEITRAMVTNESAVLSGQATIEQVARNMYEIRAQADEMTNSTAQIAAILTQQAAASEEINRGIQTISHETTKCVADTNRIVGAIKGIEDVVAHQIAEAAKMEVPDKIVKLAKSDHIAWKKRITAMFCCAEHLEADQLTDHTNCRLGKWYRSDAANAYKTNPSFAALDGPHAQVHDHGRQAVRLFNAGNHAAAMAEIEQVEKASAEVLRLLGTLETKL